MTKPSTVYQIENGRGRSKAGYASLDSTMRECDRLNVDIDEDRDKYYPLGGVGYMWVYVKRINGRFAFVESGLQKDNAIAMWVPVGVLRAEPLEGEKKEMTPERHAKLVENLRKARAARKRNKEQGK